MVAAFAVLPTADAAGKSKKPPPDRTGLDILCSGKGDVYSPPNKSGVSMCLFNDGEVLVCDQKKDKCYASMTGGKPKDIVAEGAVTLRMLKILNDKVDRLSAQVESLGGQAPTTQQSPAAPQESVAGGTPR
jgi:hypothetical protein